MTTRTPPKAHAWSTAVGILLALLLIAAGVIAVHDWLIGLGWITGDDWLTSAMEAVDDIQVETWMVVAAVPLALVGLWLVLVGIKPRRRTHQPTPDSELDLWITPGALAAIAGHAADRQPGIASATAHPRRRRIDVDISTEDRGAEVQSRVQEAVEHSLEGLTTHRVRVRAKEMPR